MPCMQLWLSNEFGASFPVSFSLKTGGNYMQRDKDPKNKDPAPPIVFFFKFLFFTWFHSKAVLKLQCIELKEKEESNMKSTQES